MSESVFELLRKRYEPPAWAFMEEVRNGTGYGRVTRTADALAMSLYPSRGLHLHGFEVKVSRADWVKELRDPDKAEEIAKYCHFWWLVISDGAIVHNGEMPATWGLLVSDGKKLKVEKDPTFNKEALPPSHKFLGAILRKFGATNTDHARIVRAKSEGHAEGFEAGKKHMEAYTSDGRVQVAYDALYKKVTEFEKVSGVDIANRWTHGNISEAVRLLVGGYGSPVHQLERIADQATEVAKVARKALAEAQRVVVPALPEEVEQEKTEVA